MFVSFDSVFESSALETPEGRTRGRISRATTRHPSTHRSNPRRRTACCRRRGHLGRAFTSIRGFSRVQQETNDTDVTRLLVSCQMKTVIPGLHASPPEPVPFGPSLEIRAFLLEREQGNVLVYRAETLKGEVAAVNELGGITRQYLNHRHEAAPVCDWVAETFGAPLFCHVDDAQSAGAGCKVGHTFSERHRLDGDFEVIPTPGHTSGSTAYLWDTGEHRCLFTGDTIVIREDEWLAVLLEGVSDRDRYIESLDLIRGLDYDLLVPSVGTAGHAHYAFVDGAEAERRIDAILERLHRGENN